MKQIVIVLLFSCFAYASNCFANAAQPGVWNAGGTVFTMLYPEDSISFQQVQMKSEQIHIQLYSGFAVVKGSYQFVNHSENALQFKMGYPVNGIYAGGSTDLNEVALDSLSQFQIFSNKQPIEIRKLPNEEYGPFITFSSNWFVWDMGFLPRETKEVDVYFIVNTSDAQVREGYNLKDYNAFIYLLESGSVWKQPIERGIFQIELMDINKEDIIGLAAAFPLQIDETGKYLFGEFANLSPTNLDNLVITYKQQNDEFDFSKVLKNTSNYYEAIDQLAAVSVQEQNLSNIEFASPYDLPASWGSFLVALPFLLIIILPIATIVLVIGLLLFYFIRRKRNRT